MGPQPFINEIEVLHFLRHTAKQVLSETLLKKTYEYSASVISTLSKLRKKTIVISGHDSLQHVLDHLDRPELLKNSANYFREYLVTDEEVARQHAESVSNIRKHYLAMGLEKLFVEEIQELLAFKVKDVNRLVSKKRLEYILNNSDRHEIMQKYAYLSLLVNNDVTVYSQLSVDYFKNTIFAPLFEGIDAHAIGNEFMALESEIDTKFTDIINGQIDRLASPGELGASARRYRLRYGDELEASYRPAIEQRESVKAIFDKKAYDYQLQTALSIISHKIIDKLVNGDVQDKFSMALALESFKRGSNTEKQKEMIDELFLETIVETDLIKLPKHFKENIKTIAHMHKKKVADTVLNHVAAKLGEEFQAGMKLRAAEGAVQLSQQKSRNPLAATPENLELIKKVKNLPFEQIARDEKLFKLASYSQIGLDLENHTFELIRNESDAKLHSIIFNPNNDHIPDNLADMTAEELEANGIKRVLGSEITVNSSGDVIDVSGSNRNLDEILDKIENVYEKKFAGSSADERPKLDAEYDDRTDDR